MSATERRLRTPPEASTRLGVPLDTLRMWRQRGKGPAYVRIGRHVRYADEDLDAFVAANRVDPSEKVA